MDYKEEFRKMLDNPEKTLFGFKEWSEGNQQRYRQFYDDNNPRPKSSFDGNGLRYDIEHLRSLGSDLILMPVEFISNYVDVVTKQNVDSQDKGFVELMLLGLGGLDEHDFIYLNATAVGNMGYFCVFSADDKAKEFVKAKMLEIFLWKLNQYKALVESLNSVN